jgi:hypothetical protein
MTAASWRGATVTPARSQAISASDKTNSAPPAAAARLRPDARMAMAKSSRLYSATGTRRLPRRRHKKARSKAHTAPYPAAAGTRARRAEPSLTSSAM